MKRNFSRGRKIRQTSSKVPLSTSLFIVRILSISTLAAYGFSVARRGQASKTLSAVKCLKKLVSQYPHAIVCTNLDVKGLPCEIIPFTDYAQLGTLTNGIKGVIFLIDEIQVLWNSLESKNISIAEMACFAQMRKDRRIILGTSQVYGRIAKPIREQLKYVIACKSYFKYIQWNTIIDPNDCPLQGTTQEDGNIDGSIIGHSLFFHHPDDYKAYSTLRKIERIERKK